MFQLTSHGPPLVVKVGENNIDTLVLLANEVFYGHLDVVVGDVRGAGDGGVGGLDELGLDALAALNEQDAEALVRLDAGDKVVGEDAVGDPLLGAVDNVVLAVGGLDGRGAQAGHVGAGKGLGDGEAHLLLATKNLVHDGLLALLVLHVVHDAGEADDHAGHVAVLEAAGVGARALLAQDHVVEVVKLLALDGAVEQVDAVQVLAGSQAHVQDAGLGHAVNELLGNVLSIGLPGLGLRSDVLVLEDAHSLLEAAVGVVVVGALVDGGEPEGLGVGDGAEVAGLGGDDRGLLALDGTDGEALVLCQDLVSVEVVKGDGGVGAGDLAEDGLTTGVGIEEVGDIVDLAVNDEPHVILARVLGDLVAGEGLGHDGWKIYIKNLEQLEGKKCTRNSKDEGMALNVPFF